MVSLNFASATLLALAVRPLHTGLTSFAVEKRFIRATSRGRYRAASAATLALRGSGVTEPGPPYGKLGAFRPDFRSHPC
jgi:hypothetical protein